MAPFDRPYTNSYQSTIQSVPGKLCRVRWWVAVDGHFKVIQIGTDRKPIFNQLTELLVAVVECTVRENVCNKAKKHKKSRF